MKKHDAVVRTPGIVITHSYQEMWNGSGYPDGLSGEDIPLTGRIRPWRMSVYAALRSKRHYKRAFSREKSCRIIPAHAGERFDPAVTDAITAAEAEFSKIRKRMNDGLPVNGTVPATLTTLTGSRAAATSRPRCRARKTSRSPSVCQTAIRGRSAGNKDRRITQGRICDVSDGF